MKKTLFITREKDGKFQAIPCNDFKEIDKKLLKRLYELDTSTPAMFVSSEDVYLMDQALTTQSPQISSTLKK